MKRRYPHSKKSVTFAKKSTGCAKGKRRDKIREEASSSSDRPIAGSSRKPSRRISSNSDGWHETIEEYGLPGEESPCQRKGCHKKQIIFKEELQTVEPDRTSQQEDSESTGSSESGASSESTITTDSGESTDVETSSEEGVEKIKVITSLKISIPLVRISPMRVTFLTKKRQSRS